MTHELLVGLVVFAFVSSITPGPNNLMLMASGVNFGFRRSIPHMLGISGGFAVLLLAVGMGLGAIVHAYPGLSLAMKFASAAYLIYLAWRIAFSRSLGSGQSGAEPLTFLQAAMFQWVNPKAWAMALGAVTTYAPEGSGWTIVPLLAGTFMLVGAPCSAAWAGFGQAMRRFLDRPAVLRTFNVTMAVLLVASLYPLFVEHPSGAKSAAREVAVGAPGSHG